MNTVLFDLDGTMLPMDQDVFAHGYFSELAKKFAAFGLDGKKLVETPVLKDGSSVPVKAAVEGGRKLEIRVDDAGDGNAADWGIIANGILTR